MTKDEQIAEEVFNTMAGKLKCKECGEWKPQRNITGAGRCWGCVASTGQPDSFKARIMGDFGMKAIRAGALMKSITS